MAKILISPLGVGGYFKDKHGDKPERNYRFTTYQIDDSSYHDSKFVSSVLYKHFKLDGIVFIGTVKSMWEAVYEFFCEIKGTDLDEDYWCELASTIDNCNCHSSLDVLDLSKLRELLGEGFQCVLIKYGISRDELWENFDRVIEIVNSFNDGDELYIDVTHAFRSLAILQFLSITFIKDLLANKKVKIMGIYYGMLDVAGAKDLGYAPIINLMPFFEMISWMQGAYSLKSFGNGYLISQLLREQGEDNIADKISLLSDAININYLTTVQERATDLRTAFQNQDCYGPFKYLKHIPEEFAKQFSRKFGRESDFQLEFAKWNFENKRYATGYITLAEAIITYLCEIHSKDINDKDSRDNMKDLLHKSENRNKELSKLFIEKINPIRNTIAHASFDKKRASYSEAIQQALNYCQRIKTIFKTGGLGS